MDVIHIKKITSKPENIFLVMALVYGLAFLFVTPPFQVPDENSHFIKDLGLDEGNLIPQKYNTETGFIVSNNIIHFISEYPHSIIKNSNQKYQFVDISNKSVVTYSPIDYSLSALTIKIGELLGASALILLYLARLVNLFTWIFLTYLAIRLIPVQKWTFLLITLMPMSLFEAASVSIDSLTIGLSFLAIAYILKLVYDSDPFKKIDYIALIVLGCLIALSKSIYILLFFLFILIPKSKFKTFKIKYVAFLVLLLILSVVTAGWADLTLGLYHPALVNYSIFGQLYFIMNNISFYASVILSNIVTQSNFYLMSIVGFFGWFEIPLPFSLVMMYLLLIWIVALLDKNKIKINSNQKLINLGIILVGFISIFTLEYLTWNSVGSNFIEGIQGRYFIPFLPVLALLFYNNIEQLTYFDKSYSFKLNKLFKMFIVEFIIATLFLSLFIMYLFYY